ncbi:SA1788 family PVL leukocidin-associated protein, partial [Staphylococcus aureus]
KHPREPNWLDVTYNQMSKKWKEV